MSPTTTVAATFTYRTTDPVANAVTGTPNPPLLTPGGGRQTFVFGFMPMAPFLPMDVQLSFDCANTDPASIVTGVNTRLLSASVELVPDIVALAATISDDRIVTVGGAARGAFAVATVNMGSEGIITASADTGDATLPLSISICQSDPATGVCLSPARASVTTQINAASTPTFAIS